VEVVVSSDVVSSVGGNACTDCQWTVDFGYRYYGTNTINGNVWRDEDRGGQTGGTGDIEVGETARYSGVTVYLWKCNGGCGGVDDDLVATAITDGSGFYEFAELGTGTFRVSLSGSDPNLSGLTATTPLAYDGDPVSAPAVTFAGSGETARRDFGFVSDMDFGDLPAGYAATVISDNGARHVIPTSGRVFLGSSNTPGDSITSENDGNESPTATQDQYDDGIVRTAMDNWSDGSASFDVDVSNCASGCYLSAWIDWNRDNDFYDANERVLLDERITADGTVTISVPAGVFTGSGSNVLLNARFRLYAATTSGLAQPTGLANNGEVEDYQWEFTPTAVRLLGFRATPAPSMPWAVLLAATLFGAVGWVYARRRR
jgi:hypothetical protein